MSVEAVNQQLRLKYQSTFFAHFANFVNELIYENIYSEYRVTTKDFLHCVSDTEHLTRYVPQDQFENESLLAFHAQLFESPLRITTEMPLMILTNTRDVFMRRRKRLRKLITNESSYSDKSSSFSPSSIISQSTIILLGQSLSNLTFMNLESSSLNSYYASSVANIFSHSSSSFKKDESTHSRLDPEEHLMIRETVENQVRHLILEFHSKQSSETIESVKSRRENLQSNDFSQQVKDFSHHEPKPSQASNNEIQTVVKAELKKYNIGQVVDLSSHSSSRLSKSKKKVREKAEELLRTISSGSII